MAELVLFVGSAESEVIMSKKWRIVLSSVIGCLLLFAGVTTVVAMVQSQPSMQELSSRCSTTYFDGDARFGPKDFPTAGAVAPILSGYRPLGGLSSAQFLAKWWDQAKNNGAGGWLYPPDSGFLVQSGRIIQFPLRLTPGQEIDRFGTEHGTFLAPDDTPYGQRALPPMSLDASEPTCNYHAYEVLKPFEVEAGPTAPWFGQSGLGLQYQLIGGMIPSLARDPSVSWLVSNDYLKRLN
jgi:hypothetical protein